MEDFLLAHGLPALFCLGFLAATLFPLGSEWLLVALLLQGISPFSAVAAATLGNYLGACATYGIGLWGEELLVRRLLRIDERGLARARLFYRHYGSWSLFFSWLPVVGDPLCLLGGMMRINFLLFSLLVASGKLLRYLLLALLTLSPA